MDFFDFKQTVIPGKAPSKPAGDPLTVSQLTQQIDRAIKSGLPTSIAVKGEISNVTIHRASGHIYFTLKDDSACIDGVMFRSDAERLKFTPADGMELLASGRVEVFAKKGKYQFYARSFSPLGKGALELAFQQLCEKLRAEGLFDAARKKSLPKYPMRIALVTSRETAALQDMLKVLRRFPWLNLKVFHVPVQGDGAAAKIAEAIRLLNRHANSLGEIDCIILSRGGGSLEDLWQFNSEVVARAMAASRIPIITGIGHEVDCAVADLVADFHAHTPTEAAQVITAHWKHANALLDMSRTRARRSLWQIFKESRQRLVAVERHEMFRRPTDRIDRLRQWLDDRERALSRGISDRLHHAMHRLSRADSQLAQWHPRHVVSLKTQTLQSLASRLSNVAKADISHRISQLDLTQRHLEAISPSAVLKRGFSITSRKKDGTILRKTNEVRVGEKVVTRFADGEIESVVADAKQLGLFE